MSEIVPYTPDPFDSIIRELPEGTTDASHAEPSQGPGGDDVAEIDRERLVRNIR